MKNTIIISLFIICLVLGSCQNKKSETTDTTENVKYDQCYKAIYEKDTLHLKFNTLEDGKVDGSLVMTIADIAKRTGQISGKFRGDTLFANYKFTQGENRISTYKTPLAFLKQGDAFILGDWDNEIAMDSSYSASGKEIDFEQIKYKFITVKCD